MSETQRLGGGALAVTIAVLLGGHAKAQQPTPTPAPQQPKPPQQQTAQLPEVLVTGQDDYRSPALSLQRVTEPLLTTPQSANVITKQLLQDQGVTSLKDSLRNVSGVSIGAGEGSYQGDNFSIRGFAARSDIYLDGMTDFGSYNRDPFNMEQIEVLKGPDSALFGRGSSGGAVNQESKTPQNRFFTEGSLEYGTDNTERGTLDFNQPIPGIPNAAPPSERDGRSLGCRRAQRGELCAVGHRAIAGFRRRYADAADLELLSSIRKQRSRLWDSLAL